MDISFATHHLQMKHKIGYSLGHAASDILFAFRMGYIAVFSMVTLQLDVKYVGYFILAQHFTDALLTPVIGILSDKWNGCCRLGKYKSWYLFGSAMEMTFFAVVFCVPFVDADSPELVRFFVYLPLFAIVAAANGIVNVSHLTILPRITNSSTQRTQLNGWRFAITALCHVVAYGVAWLFLFIDKETTDKEMLTTKDTPAFRKTSAVLTCIGIVATTIFLITVKEHGVSSKLLGLHHETTDNIETISAKFDIGKPPNTCLYHEYSLEKVQSGNDIQNERNFYKRFTDVISDVNFIKVGSIYVFSRMAVVISSVYMPLYVTETLEMDKVAVAIVPMLVYSSGFVASVIVVEVNYILGRERTIMTGLVLTLASTVWIFCLSTDTYIQIYAASIFFGAGLSSVQTTAMAMVADLVGKKQEHGARIFSMFRCAMTIIQGLVFVLMQNLNPCSAEPSESCRTFYQIAMMSAPGGATLLSFLVLIVTRLHVYNKNNSHKTALHVNSR